MRGTIATAETPTTLALPAVTRHLRVEPRLATTLIVASSSSQSNDYVIKALEASGRHCVALDNYRDACAILQSETIRVDSALVSADADLHVSILFSWLKSRYPDIKRITLARLTVNGESLAAMRTCEQDTILWDGGDAASFGALLDAALARRAPRVRSSWSDLQLFRSANGRDRRAVCEILRRYRQRIEHLVANATGCDTDDVAQEVFLRIMHTMPSFSGPCSPGHWIDRTSREAIGRCLSRRSELIAGDAASVRHLSASSSRAR